MNDRRSMIRRPEIDWEMGGDAKTREQNGKKAIENEKRRRVDYGRTDVWVPRPEKLSILSVLLVVRRELCPSWDPRV